MTGTHGGSKPVLTVRADAGVAVGYGHLQRSMSIARALRELAGWPWWYAALPGADAGPARRAHGVVVSLPDRSLEALMRAHDPDAGPLLLDGYDLDGRDLSALRRAGYCTVVLDDHGRKGWYPADLVVDGGPGAEAEDYRGPRGTRFCLGASFCPLRPEIRVARDAVESAAARAGTRATQLVITFGGSDPDDQTARLLALCDAIDRRLRVQAILGPGYRGRARAVASPRVELVRSPDDLAERFADADIAVSGAGGTALELAYLGVPTVLLELAANQRRNAASLERAGAAITLGDFRQVDDAAIVDALRLLVRDDARRRVMSGRGRRLIDGRGPRRVARAIVKCWTAMRARRAATVVVDAGRTLAGTSTGSESRR